MFYVPFILHVRRFRGLVFVLKEDLGLHGISWMMNVSMSTEKAPTHQQISCYPSFSTLSYCLAEWLIGNA